MTKTVVKENGKKDIVKTYSYNQNGAMLSEREEGGISKAYTYDNRNRKISETTSGTGLSSATTTTSYGYDTDIRIHDGRSVRTEPFTFVETTTSPLGNTTSAYINGTGNTLKEVAGDTYVDYTYDKSGNTVVTYTGTSKSNDYELSLVLYNEEGKQFAQISQPDIRNDAYIVGKDSVVTYTEYDGKGNVTREIDGEGNAVSYTYDDEGRLSACDVADDGNDITAAYSTEDDDTMVTTVTDARGNQKVEKTNQAGLTILVRDTDTDADVSIQTTYEYDSIGRKIKEIKSDNAYIEYTYDGDSERVLTEIAYKPDETLESKTTYTYDDFGRVVKTALSGLTNCTTTYTYDAEGKKLSETVNYGTGSDAVTTYTYDAEGKLTQTIYPAESGLGTINYVYDAKGRISEISSKGGTIRKYTYDGLSRVTGIKDFSSPGSTSYTNKAYTYDRQGRATSMVYSNSDGKKTLESFAYTYDKANKVTSLRHINNLPKDSQKIDEDRNYQYDSYGRLAQSIRIDHKRSDAESRTVYSYDAVGNRISMTENGKTTEYTYNGLNQLTETNTPESEILYTYDRCGNQIKEENTTENTVKESVYSVNGEMLSQQTKSGKSVFSSQENAYNQEGIRISRKEGNVLRRYYYDNGLLAYTKDGTTISSANILGTDGNIIGTYRGKTYHQYLKDVQGSTSSIVKEDGSLSAAYAYSDFGETTELTGGGFDNEICYTGGIYDQNTGLYYLNARYYDPTTGRFISQDSYRGEMSEPGQWHLYAYCANDPINYVDPSGHLRKHWWNSVKWVGNFIDAGLIIFGLKTTFVTKKALKKYLKAHGPRIKRVAKKELQKRIPRISTAFISSAFEMILMFSSTSIGRIIAKGLDYVDSWWGYRRNNGYILN